MKNFFEINAIVIKEIKNPYEHIKVGIQLMKHQSSRLKVVDQEPWFFKL
jgi:hypothetical protein